MNLNIDATWAMTVFCIALRIGTLLIMSPIFSSLSGLITVRVLFSLALAALLAPAVPLPLPNLTLGYVIWAAIIELFIGATMAFGVLSAFAAFAVAGKILDIQSGFGVGNVYDPVTRASAAMFATMLNLAAVAIFFALDAHHALMRGIAFSLQQLPPGSGFSNLAIEPVIRQFGLMFSLGMAIVIPVVLGLLLVDAGLAVISRILPQMNIFMIGVPVKIMCGLVLFALSAPLLGPVMTKVYLSIFEFWQQILT